MVENRDRQIYYLLGMIVSAVALLAVFWEFFLEDQLVPHIYEYYHSEPIYERLEYIVTVLVVVIIALVLPARLALNSVRESDQAKRALSSAYEDLDKRVQDRTRQLVDANEHLRRVMEKQQRSEDALRESEKEYRLLSSHLLTAMEMERRRIALDLHDNVTQTLVAMKYRIEQSLGELDGNTAQPAKIATILVPLIQASIEEVRNMYMRLRPSILDDLGLSAALTWLCRDFQDTHPDIRVQSQIDVADSEIDDTLKIVIYRVVQEALSNVGQHSQAKQVHIALRKANDLIELAIEDNGNGFRLEEILSVDDSLRGIGLSGMRERVHLAGGTLRIDSEKGTGTQICASWPIRRDSA